MGRKSGRAGTAVKPSAPTAAEDADFADPGKMAKIKADQIEKEEGKYGSQKETPHKTDDEEKDETAAQSWIEIELVGEDEAPIPGEAYKLTLSNGAVANGTLNEKGFARIEGIESGSCKITFPNLDKEAWEPE